VAVRVERVYGLYHDAGRRQMGTTDEDDRVNSPVTLVGDQRSLYERLVDRDSSGALAGMYRGALIALEDADNPDGLAQAAHSVREMMEKLAYLEHGDAEPGSMGGHTTDLKTLWNGYKESVGSTVDELHDARVGPALIEVLRQVDALVTWTERNRMSGRTQAQRVLEHLKVSGFTMPPEQQRENVKTWMDLRDFFVRASHHGATDPPTFTSQLTRLEHFLLDLWMPDTAGDFAELDRITGTADAH
jgi:hypothetical protein